MATGKSLMRRNLAFLALFAVSVAARQPQAYAESQSSCRISSTLGQGSATALCRANEMVRPVTVAEEAPSRGVSFPT